MQKCFAHHFRQHLAFRFCLVKRVDKKDWKSPENLISRIFLSGNEFQSAAQVMSAKIDLVFRNHRWAQGREGRPRPNSASNYLRSFLLGPLGSGLRALGQIQHWKSHACADAYGIFKQVVCFESKQGFLPINGAMLFAVQPNISILDEPTVDNNRI
jgi:hypothetical protein